MKQVFVSNKQEHLVTEFLHEEGEEGVIEHNKLTAIASFPFTRWSSQAESTESQSRVPASKH